MCPQSHFFWRFSQFWIDSKLTRIVVLTEKIILGIFSIKIDSPGVIFLTLEFYEMEITAIELRYLITVSFTVIML